MSTLSFDNYLKKVFYGLETYTIKTSKQARKTVYPVRVLNKHGDLIKDISIQEVQDHLDEEFKSVENNVFRNRGNIKFRSDNKK